LKTEIEEFLVPGVAYGNSGPWELVEIGGWIPDQVRDDDYAVRDNNYVVRGVDS